MNAERMRITRTFRIPRQARAMVISFLVAMLCPAAAAAAPGAVDTSYGAGGSARPADPSTVSFGIAASSAPDGSLVVAGAGTSIRLSRDADFGFDIRVHPTVYRYLPDGSPDPAFGTGGAAKVFVQNHLSFVTDVLLQPDGTVYVTGTSIGLLSASTFVARLRADGSLDPSFGGGDGYVTVLPERLNLLVPVSLGTLADGRVVVVGTSFAGDLATLFSDRRTRRRADLDVVLMRFLATGALDSTYGTGGMVEYDTAGTSSLDAAVVAHVAESGEVTVGGVTVPDSLDRSRALVVRFGPDGAPSAAFGRAGVAPQPVRRDYFDVVTALEVRADGGASVGVVHGSVGSESVTPVIRRLSPLGRQLRWPSGAIGARVPGDIVPTAIRTLVDGRTLVGGAGTRWGLEEGTGSVAGLARLRASGAPDRSFDRGGASFFGREDSELHQSVVAALDPRPDGSILAAGTFESRAGAIRILGDSSPRLHIPAVRVTAAGPGLRRCGFRRSAPCLVDGSRFGAPRFDVLTGRRVPTGHAVHLRVDYGAHGEWWQEESRRLRIGNRGRASARLELGEWPGLYRIRAAVPASATTGSVVSRPLYIRVRSPRRGVGSAVPTVKTAQVACARAKRSSGVLAMTTTMGCDAVKSAQREGIGPREAARRLLGR